MKQLLVIFLILSGGIVLNPGRAAAQQVETVSFAQIEQLMANPSDTVYVVNFWATWCAPCVRELPHFEKLQQEHQNKNLKVILVSLDFEADIQKKLIPFLEKRKITAQVLLLDDTNYNSWIHKVEKNWQGNIPVTLVFNNVQKIRKFINGELKADELEQIVVPLLK